MFILLLLVVPAVRASEFPRKVWVESRCALCHGLDGSSQTDAGRETGAPDLRAPETQKLTDEELGKIISSGHKQMPSFQKQITAEKVNLLVKYIRGLAKK